MKKITKKELEKSWKKFDNLNQSKWMRYEKDIIRYYHEGIIRWMDEGFQWSGTAFTSGLGRDIARLIEEGIRRQCGEVKVTKEFGGRYG